MALRTRIAALEHRAGDRRTDPPVVVDVPYFEPGPDAGAAAPVRIIVRDPRGDQRVLGSLHQCYEATSTIPAAGVSGHHPRP